MSKELMKEKEKKMTTDSHSGGLERSHNRGKMRNGDAKENVKRMSQEEIDRGIVELNNNSMH